MRSIPALIASTLLVSSLCVHPVFAQSETKKINPAEAKRNRLANDAFLRALQTGDVSNLAAITDVRFINHGVGEKIGLDSLQSSIKTFHSRFKPTRVEVISRTTDGEYFGDWVRFIGPTAGVVIEGIEMTKYSNGKAMEHWFFPNNQRRTNQPGP